MKDRIDIPIGETFEFDENTYKVVREIYKCEGCAFETLHVCGIAPRCYCEARSDKKGAIFVKVEKSNDESLKGKDIPIGKPFEMNGNTYELVEISD